MRSNYLVRFLALACILAGGRDAFACQCGGGVHGKTPWETARLEEEHSTTVFEGVPQRFEVEWGILNAKEGEWIPADSSGPSSWPRMLVTFRVQRSYKGQLPEEVKVRTGLGGGDCGAIFAPGLTYVVYTSESVPGEASVNMCSPGGWIGEKSVETDLRHLRKEDPIPADMVQPKNWSQLTEKEADELQEKRQQSSRVSAERYAAVTGRICGIVVGDKSGNDRPVRISFLSIQGYSPVAHPSTTERPNGSFCSDRLGPGKYYLYLTRSLQDGTRSAFYYPGTSERGEATAVTVNAGQDHSGIVVKFIEQETYSVRGFISINDKSSLRSNRAAVMLMGVDGDRENFYEEEIDLQDSFMFSKTKYFKFANVVPGRYIAYANVSGGNWQTKKVEVTVTTHMKFISLELANKK